MTVWGVQAGRERPGDVTGRACTKDVPNRAHFRDRPRSESVEARAGDGIVHIGAVPGAGASHWHHGGH